MRFRKLRISWLLGWGLITALVVAMWVRSYWRMEEANYVLRPTQVAVLASVQGQISMRIAPWQFTGKPFSFVRTYWKPKVVPLKDDILGFYFSKSPNRVVLILPYWSIALLSVGVAPLAFVRWRFSLRAMLIATALLSVLIGVAVWQLRRP